MLNNYTAMFVCETHFYHIVDHVSYMQKQYWDYVVEGSG